MKAIVKQERRGCIVRPSEQKATLTQVTLKNFKSYRNANLPIAPLTFLIGANASGKSNAIEVLRFVHGIASGRYLDDVYKDLHDAGTLRGSRATLVWDQKSPFSICLTANIESQKMIWSIKVGTFPELVLLAETLKFGSEKIPTYQVVSRENGAPHTLLVAYNNFARGGKKPRLWADDRKPLFDQLNTPAVFTTHQAQKMIDDNKDKIDETDKKELEEKIANLKKVMENPDSTKSDLE